MNRFGYDRATDVASAIAARGMDTNGAFIAGGTNLIDLMKENVARPSRLVDINHLDLRAIAPTDKGGLSIGALVSNTNLAYDDTVRRDHPLLSSAILAGASPQLRNMASTGGNLLQRTRCYYFYDTATACNKREPGTGCSAIGGVNRIHAILGTSDQCIATHPSDMCVGLAALDATVHVEGADGARDIAFGDLHRLPGDTPQIDTNLKPGELITAIVLPPEHFTSNYTYLKLRDRASYAFALVSVAVALQLDGDGIGSARLALGGVAHKPWRDPEVEEFLKGKPATREVFAGAANLLLRDARGFGENDFKIELARRAIVRALTQAHAGTPQSQTDKRVA